jgi:hypothetical protein
MNTDIYEEAAVGYGKPPKHSQFKPGQSGNPSGRKRKEKKFSDPNPVREILLEEIKIMINGKKRKMSKAQALVHKYVGMAMSGDYKAAGLIFRHSGGMDVLQLWDEKRASRSR